MNEGLSDTLYPQNFRQFSADERGAIRDRRGEEGYHALLYAIGQENKLMVTRVPEGTPGALAGAQHGDELLFVDGQRVFNRTELSWLKPGLGAAGSFPITVMRGGEPVELWVENGRMRVGLERIYQPPYHR
jgi:S1-C subfamily serine protease